MSEHGSNYQRTLLDAARGYVTAGVSVVPIYGDRDPAKRTKGPDWRVLPREYDAAEQREKAVWKPYQSHQATDAELLHWFGAEPVQTGAIVRGLGIVGGIVSGHLEILDFDQVGLYEQWVETCVDHEVGEIIDSLPLVVTPSGGRHLYYRCETPVGGNVKLAMEPIEVPAETNGKKTKGAKMIGDRLCRLETRIETRGEGGYVLAPPSPAECHPDNLAYVLARGDLARIPTISADQRAAFHRMAQLYNLYVEPERILGRTAPRPSGSGQRPGEDYNQRGDYEQLLEEIGWRRVGHHGDKTLWCRPGKQGRHISATTNYAGSGLFFAFSSNAAPFEMQRSYTPFGVYAALKHDGDFKNAARELGRQGYGEQRPPRREPPTSTDADPAPLPAPAPTDTDAPDPDEDEEPAPEPKRPPSAYFATDTANARRFVSQHKDVAKFDHSSGKWYVWDGKRWALDQTNRVQELAKLTARNIFREAADCPDNIQAIELAKFAKKSLDATRLTAMVKLASSDAQVAVTHSDWDQDQWKLNVANGTLNLLTGQLEPHRREDLITRLAPVDFDAAAAAPTFTQAMEIWQPVEAVRSFIQRLSGYTLSGSVEEHVVAYVYGPGGNGKSVFIEILKRILGDYGVKSQRETFMLSSHGKNSGAASPELMDLIGKRFVSVAEVQQGDRLNEALIKDLSGGDTVCARGLYSGNVNFKPVCKLWMFGNYKPRITGDDKGIWRRVLVVPFIAEISEDQKDKRLFDKLNGEMPGILNWLIAGCLEWRRSGLQPPREVLLATQDYRNEQDIVGAFIEECCASHKYASAAAGELYKAYEAWCKENGEYVKSQRFFGTSLAQRGYENVKSNNVRKWRGIGILSDAEREYVDEHGKGEIDAPDPAEAQPAPATPPLFTDTEIAPNPPKKVWHRI